MVASNKKKPKSTIVRWMANLANEEYVSRKDLLKFLKEDDFLKKQIPGARYVNEWLICILEEMRDPEGHSENDTGIYQWNDEVSLRYVVGSEGDGCFIRLIDFYNLLDMKRKNEEDGLYDNTDFLRIGIAYAKAKLEYMHKGEKSLDPPPK